MKALTTAVRLILIGISLTSCATSDDSNKPPFGRSPGDDVNNPPYAQSSGQKSGGR